MQTDSIRDYVVPLAEGPRCAADGLSVARFLGTSFFLGSRSVLLTAAHVLTPGSSPVAAMLVAHGEWRAYLVEAWEAHPTEDVAVARVTPPPGDSSKSIFRLGEDLAASALPYSVWGYPSDVAEELEHGGKIQLRPDLVYSAGHVRRRITNIPLPAIHGSQFLELSAVAGAGCSGSPVLSGVPGRHWNVIGLYIGERMNDRATSVGYAVRAEAFRDWVPKTVDRSLLADSNNED